MKKLLMVLLALTVVFSFAACKTEGNENKEPSILEGSLEDILAKIYETADLEESDKKFRRITQNTFWVKKAWSLRKPLLLNPSCLPVHIPCAWYV